MVSNLEWISKKGVRYRTNKAVIVISVTNSLRNRKDRKNIYKINVQEKKLPMVLIAFLKKRKEKEKVDHIIFLKTIEKAKQ